MDFASRFLGGYGQGRQDKLASEQRAKQERVNALLGQAYADPSQRDAILAQAAPIDIGATVQLDTALAGRDDRINKGRANLARTYLAMPEQGRQRFKQQFGQDFQRLGLDPNAPDFDQIATGYAQMGMSGAELPADIRTLQMLQANPELLAVNDRFRGQKSFKEVTNPDGSVSYIALDNRTGTGSAAPVGMMGQPAPRPQAPASGSPNMDALAQAANQMIAAGIPPEQVDAIIMQAAQRTQGVQVQPPGMSPAGGPSVAPQAAPAPSIGLGQTDADRARAAAQQAALVKQAEIEAQLRYAPQVAQQDASREGALAAARAAAERAATGEKKEASATDSLNLLAEAEPLIRASTSGAVANVSDNLRGAFGQSTPGAQAIAALKTISGQLVAKMPRMEGPQSDRDVQMYKDMAGDLANPNVPAQTRLAALATIRRLNEEYAPGGAKYTPPAGQSAPQGNRIRYDAQGNRL